MFGSRRQRRPNPPLTAATANRDAATAAAAVFKKQSGTSLSAAAAAAALRARPHTPTNVADVQTKRTVRRNGSVSSSHAVQDAFSTPSLRRRGSSASMTERTFRSPSPSPHRPASAHGSLPGRAGIGRDMPPVPAIPKDLDTASIKSGTSARSQVRKTAIGISSGTPVRVASQRLGQDVAPTWFGAAQVGDAGNVRRIDPAMASPPSSPPQPAVEERVDDGAPRASSPSSSINFSYPARVRVGSPPPASPEDSRHSMEFSRRGTGSQGLGSGHQPHGPKQANGLSSDSLALSATARPSSSHSDRSLVYDPNSRRMVPREDAPEVRSAIPETSEKQTTARRKNQPSNRAASHLPRGTMGRTQVHIPETQDFPSPDRSAVREDVSWSRTKMVQKHAVQQQSSREPTFDQDSAVLDVAPKEKRRDVTQTTQPIRRQPSVVKEESESETDFSEPETTWPHQDMMSALDQIPSKSKLSSTLIHTSDSKTQAPAAVEKRRPAPPVEFIAPVSPQRQPSPSVEHAVSVYLTEPKTGIASPRHGLRETEHERGQSRSPARQTHFGPVQNTLTVRHSPPPRSISPRKSALKHQSPSRGASSTDTNSEASAHRDDLAIPRKKSARVSFHDEHTVFVGESATHPGDESPVPASPQHNPHRRSWYSTITRGKQRDVVFLDDDEVMKPRPALPSFGSVRAKKPRELQNGDAERALVRPAAETVYSPILPSTPAESPTRAHVAAPSQAQPESLGFSNDVAVGALLDQEQSQRRRNAANISKYREPLPPIVTTVEGAEYTGDSASSSDVEEPQALTHAHVEEEHSHEESVATNGSTAQPSEPDLTSVVPEIPSIAVTLPSPAIEKFPLHEIGVHVPGEFPEDESDLSASELPAAVRQDTSGDAVDPTGHSAFESLAKNDDTLNDTRAAAITRAPQSQSQQSLEEETDNDSIYSDAYEDIEGEGSGFLSLNAVLEGPVVNTMACPSSVSVPHENTSQLSDLELACSSATTVVESRESQAPQEIHPVDDWEKAKAYWRGLTADKRAQLEKEARDDAGTDADVEETKPDSLPRRKKSVERRVSARQGLEQRQQRQQEQRQQQQQQQQRAPNPERSYMIQPGSKWTEQDVSISVDPSVRTTKREGRHKKQNNKQKSQAVIEKPHMRQSMRANGPATANAAQRPPTAKERPSPHPPPGPDAQPAKKAAQRASAAKIAPPPPPLRRRGSDSSETSFVRVRSGNSVQTSGFNRSMRAPPMAPGRAEPTQPSSGRKFLRALSPSRPSSRRAADPPPVAMAVKPTIRQSLRDSSVERKSGGMHMPSFRRPSSNKASRSQSRFEDSSDDDVVSHMPVMPKPSTLSRATQSASSTHTGIQQPHANTAVLEEDEASSEELFDSSDEEAPVTKDRKTQQTALALAALNQQRGSLGSSQPSPALVGTATTANPIVSSGAGHKRRNSLMAVLLRRKMSGGQAGVSRPEVTDSTLRRDTKLAASADELGGINEQSLVRNSKLQRRVTSLPASATLPSGMFSRRWGSHHHEGEATLDMSGAVSGSPVDYERQIMASNRASVGAGSLGTRSLSTGSLLRAGPQLSSYSQSTVAESPGSTGAMVGTDVASPKKKFGALRKMFRIDD